MKFGNQVGVVGMVAEEETVQPTRERMTDDPSTGRPSPTQRKGKGCVRLGLPRAAVDRGRQTLERRGASEPDRM